MLIELEHCDGGALGEKGKLAAARLDLAARFLELDELTLQLLIEDAVIVGQLAVGAAQPVAGVEDVAEPVGNRDVDGVEHGNQQGELSKEPVAERAKHIGERRDDAGG